MSKAVLRHSWEVSPAEAAEIQNRLARELVIENQLGPVGRIAGVDVGFPKAGDERVAQAALAVLDFPSLDLLETAVAQKPIPFPYVPGLLTFREGPVICAAMEKLSRMPDLLIFDGQGIAHPRRLGIAAHMGLITDIPAIGCAKSRLWGRYREPEAEKGSRSPMIHNGETIGAALRTRTGVKPVFVSPGHRVDLETSVRYVMACCTKYRLPETTRWADRIAGGKLPQTTP